MCVMTRYRKQSILFVSACSLLLGASCQGFALLPPPCSQRHPSLSTQKKQSLWWLSLSSPPSARLRLTPQSDSDDSSSGSSSNISEDASNDDANSSDRKLARLGFSPEEIQRGRKTPQEDKENLPVNVNLLPDVDAVTLTAVGFGLIAFNFFVLANLGDGGLAGAIATIINLSQQ